MRPHGNVGPRHLTLPPAPARPSLRAQAPVWRVFASTPTVAVLSAVARA